MNAASSAQPQAQDFSQLVDGTPFLADLNLLNEVAYKNVRKKRDPNKFAELVKSIETQGVTQSITVRPLPSDSSQLEVLAGYGRWEAAKQLGLSSIPVTLKQVDDKAAFAITLDENLQREELSFVDEARASQQFVSLYDGDYAQAAQHLGWTEKKVRQRLEIMNCCEGVLNTLEDGQIQLGHASILCSFSEKTQQATLKKILTEGWTVELLKQRAEGATVNLEKAPFDKTECNSCQYNTNQQAGLFDDQLVGKCTLRSCYGQKMTEWGEAKKAELLTESYSKVFLSLEKPADQRKTVSPELVGQDQFAGGCSGCDNCSAVLELQPPATGAIYENQCVDLTCFDKQVKKWKQAQIQTIEVQQQSSSVAAQADKPVAEKADKKAVPLAQATPKAVIEAHREYLRQQGAESVQKDENFFRAMQVYALLKVVANQGEAQKQVAQIIGMDDKELNGRADKVVRYLAGFDAKALAQAGMALIRFAATKASDNTDNFTSLMQGMVADRDYTETALNQWKPTAKIVNAYRKPRLVAIAEESGFAKAYDADQGDKAFAKLCNGKKSDIEKALVEFPFDWSGYAPSELKELIPAALG